MNSGDVIRYRADALTGTTYYHREAGSGYGSAKPEEISVIIFLDREEDGLYRCLLTKTNGEIIEARLPKYAGAYNGNYLYILLDE